MFLIQSDDSTVVVQLDGTDAAKRQIGRVIVEGETLTTSSPYLPVFILRL